MILSPDERYVDLSNKLIRKNADYLINLWYDFVSDNDEGLEQNKDYFIHERNLFEIIKRTDKRKVYYHVFHEKIDYNNVSEYKEVAILSYWINTFKPFMVVNSKSPIYNCPNEMFSLYIILCFLARVYKKQYNKDLPELPKQKITDYVYNFKYCDLSREATIQFVDMLASIYGIGTDIVIPKKNT